jgi:hypothetical protein
MKTIAVEIGYDENGKHLMWIGFPIEGGKIQTIKVTQNQFKDLLEDLQKADKKWEESIDKHCGIEQ